MKWGNKTVKWGSNTVKWENKTVNWGNKTASAVAMDVLEHLGLDWKAFLGKGYELLGPVWGKNARLHPRCNEGNIRDLHLQVKWFLKKKVNLY